MPNQLLPIGPPTVLVTNQVYALPAVRTTLFCSDTAPTLEVSNDATFTVKATLALAAGQAPAAGTFLRTTSGGPITVVLKRD
jgi:hypothetical protein